MRRHRTPPEPDVELLPERSDRIYLEGAAEVYSQPRLLQGVFPFERRGLDAPFLIAPELSYTIPSDKRAQLIYLRGGNSLDDLIYLILTRDGAPMRYFPICARFGCHTALAVVEDLLPRTRIQVLLAAPDGAQGHLVVDVGLVEI